MPIFSKRHYIAIAEAFRKEGFITDSAMNVLADLFEKDNPAFRRGSFIYATRTQRHIPMVGKGHRWVCYVCGKTWWHLSEVDDSFCPGKVA